MYGLESLHLNKDQRKRLNVIQLKGYRQILKLPTTFGQMQMGVSPTWDNPRVYALINAKINSWEARSKGRGYFKKTKTILPLSDYYFQVKRKAIIQLLNQEDGEPTKRVTIDDNLKLKEYNFKKQGGVKHNWWEKGLKEYWEFLKIEHLLQRRRTRRKHRGAQSSLKNGSNKRLGTQKRTRHNGTAT